MKQLSLAFLLGLMGTSVAHGAAIKNKDLLAACQDKGPAGQNFCYGYIVSATNAAQYYRNLLDTQNVYLNVCFPPNVTNRMIVKTYVDWVKQYPSVLDGAAFVGVSTALSSKYSCPDEPLA